MARLKANRDGQRSKSKYSASENHVAHEEYMSEFEKAWHDMRGMKDGHEIDAHSSPAGLEPATGGPKRGYQSILPPSVADGWLTGPVDELGASKVLVSSALGTAQAVGLHKGTTFPHKPAFELK
jgi:hypothetical protein